MKIEPVGSYQPPEQSGFTLKTGAKLAAGVAAAALIGASLSGCELIEPLLNKPSPTDLQIEVLDGDVAMTLDPEVTEPAIVTPSPQPETADQLIYEWEEGDSPSIDYMNTEMTLGVLPVPEMTESAQSID